MARPTRETPVISALGPALLRYVRARGGDAACVASQAGVPPEIERDDEAALPPAALSALMESASAHLGEPFLALRLPEELPLRRYGLAELSARASATVRDALLCLARYAPLVHPELACTLEEAGGACLWRQRGPRMPRRGARHASEYGLAYALTQCRRESGEPIAPLGVWFAHARPRDLAPLHRFFETRELTFGAEDSGLALPRAALDLPMRGKDARLLVTATELADAALRVQPRPRALASLVAARLDDLLPAGADTDAVARLLHMSARTLQRRLEDEGTRFSEVLDGVREQRARRLIDDPTLTLVEVGDQVGFADLAAFSRAFKRWTGQPPGMWRMRSRG